MSRVKWMLLQPILFQAIHPTTERCPRTPKLPDSSTHIKLRVLPTAPKPDLPKPDISSNEPQGQVKQSNATGVQKTRRLGARKKSSVEISVASNVPELFTDLKPISSRPGMITDGTDGPPQEKRSKSKDVQRPKRRLALKKSTVNTSTTSSVPEIPGNPKGTSSTEGQSTFSPDVLAQVKQSKATGVKSPNYQQIEVNLMLTQI